MRKKSIKELYVHTKRRVYERYGVEITQNEYELWNTKIKKDAKDGFVSPLYKQSLTRTVHKINMIDKPIIVVYDKTRKLVTTALPPECENPDFNTYLTTGEILLDD